MHELAIPPKCDGEEDAYEVIRFWVKDGVQHISLKVGHFDPQDETRVWGCMLADIAMHAVNGMVQDRPEIGSKDIVLAEIEVGYSDRLTAYPEISGSIIRKKH